MTIKGMEVSTETVLEIGKFATLWNWFENAKCKNHCTVGKVSSVAEGLRLDRGLLVNFSNVLGHRVELLAGGNATKYVIERLDSTDPRKRLSSRDVSAIEGFIDMSGGEQDITRGALLAIYRIRNNMFHGMKGVWDLDNQIEIFRAANAILEEVPS